VATVQAVKHVQTVQNAGELGNCTAEALRTRSKTFLIKKFSDLCELGGPEKKSMCRDLA
jgi:hypothetical protein